MLHLKIEMNFSNSSKIMQISKIFNDKLWTSNIPWRLHGNIFENEKCFKFFINDTGKEKMKIKPILINYLYKWINNYVGKRNIFYSLSDSKTFLFCYIY